MKFKIYVENRDLFENDWMTVNQETVKELKEKIPKNKISDEILISFYKSIKALQNPLGNRLYFIKKMYENSKKTISQEINPDFAYGLEQIIKKLIEKENISDAERYVLGGGTDFTFR